MPSFVTAFGAILSELPGKLGAKIPLSILGPLAITVAALLSVFARVHGLKTLQDLWSDATAVEQSLLSGLAIAVFYVVAYVLAALQPVVEQGFQQAFGIRGLKQVLTAAHRTEWEYRFIEERLWRNLYNDLKRERETVDDLLNDLNKESTPGAVTIAPAAPGAGASIAPTTAPISRRALAPVSDEGTPPSSAGGEGEDVEQTKTKKEDAAKARLENLRKGPWFLGMHQLSLGIAAIDLPRDVEPGSTVHLLDCMSDAPSLVPGGALVIDLHPKPGETDGVYRGRLVQIVVAVPPDRVRGILSAHAAGTVAIVTRPTPQDTPLWDDAIQYTRRWLPAPGDGSLPSAGDMLDITIALATGTPIDLKEIVFAEAIDCGWVVAVPLSDASRLSPDLVGTIPPPGLTWTQSIVEVPAFADEISPWTTFPIPGPLPQPIIQGTVHAGVFTTDEISHPDIVINGDELHGRYASAADRIPADQPIKREWIGPPPDEKDKVTIIEIENWNTPSVEPNPGDMVHLISRHENGVTADIAFDCLMLTDNRAVIPKGFTSSSFDRLDLAPKAVFGDFPLTAMLYVATLEFVHPDTGEHISGIPLSRPLVASQLELTPNHFAHGQLGRISKPWRSFQAFRIGEDESLFALDSDPASTIPESANLSLFASFSDLWKKLEIQPYSSQTNSFDAALAIARQLQASEICLKFLGLSTVEPDDDTRKHHELAKGYLQRFYDDVELMTRDCQTQVDQSRTRMRLFYPREKSRVQPTAVGSILASVESYGFHTYGLDTPLVFARLRNLLDDKAITGLKDAHEQFRFMQWSLLAMITIGTVGSAIAAHDHERGLMFSLWFVMLIVAPFLLQRAMVSAALAYAEQLKYILDRYRGLVLGAMGITPKRDKDEKTHVGDEKKTWTALGQWWEYSDGKFKDGYVLDLGKGAAAGDSSGEAKTKP